MVGHVVMFDGRTSRFRISTKLCNDKCDACDSNNMW